MRVYAARAALAEGAAVRLRVPTGAGLSTRLLAYEVRARARRRPGEALRVLRAGLDELHQWQATFGSLDLQTATVDAAALARMQAASPGSPGSPRERAGEENA